MRPRRCCGSSRYDASHRGASRPPRRRAAEQHPDAPLCLHTRASPRRRAAMASRSDHVAPRLAAVALIVRHATPSLNPHSGIGFPTTPSGCFAAENFPKHDVSRIHNDNNNDNNINDINNFNDDNDNDNTHATLLTPAPHPKRAASASRARSLAKGKLPASATGSGTRTSTTTTTSSSRARSVGPAAGLPPRPPADQHSPPATRDLFQSGELLFIRRTVRTSDPWSGHMAFPGGRAHARETALDAVVRETREEVGIDLSSGAFVCVGRLQDRAVVPPGSSSAALIVSAFVFVQDAAWPLASPRDTTLILQQDEVASAHWVPLNFFLGAAEDITRWRKIPMKISSFVFRSSKWSKPHKDRRQQQQQQQPGRCIEAVKLVLDLFFGSCTAGGLMLPLPEGFSESTGRREKSRRGVSSPPTPTTQATFDGKRRLHKSQPSVFSLINPPMSGSQKSPEVPSFFVSETSVIVSSQTRTPSPPLPNSQVGMPAELDNNEQQTKPTQNALDQDYTVEATTEGQENLSQSLRAGQSSSTRLLLWGLTLDMTLDFLDNAPFGYGAHYNLLNNENIFPKRVSTRALRRNAELKFDHADIQMLFKSLQYAFVGISAWRGLFHRKKDSPNIVRNSPWSSPPLFVRSLSDTSPTGHKPPSGIVFHKSMPELEEVDCLDRGRPSSIEEGDESESMNLLRASVARFPPPGKPSAEGFIQRGVIVATLATTVFVRSTVTFLLYRALKKAMALFYAPKKTPPAVVQNPPRSYSAARGISTSVVETARLPKKRGGASADLVGVPIIPAPPPPRSIPTQVVPPVTEPIHALPPPPPTAPGASSAPLASPPQPKPQAPPPIQNHTVGNPEPISSGIAETGKSTSSQMGSMAATPPTMLSELSAVQSIVPGQSQTQVQMVSASQMDLSSKVSLVSRFPSLDVNDSLSTLVNVMVGQHTKNFDTLGLLSASQSDKPVFGLDWLRRFLFESSSSTLASTGG